MLLSRRILYNVGLLNIIWVKSVWLVLALNTVSIFVSSISHQITLILIITHLYLALHLSTCDWCRAQRTRLRGVLLRAQRLDRAETKHTRTQISRLQPNSLEPSFMQCPHIFFLAEGIFIDLFSHVYICLNLQIMFQIYRQYQSPSSSPAT